MVTPIVIETRRNGRPVYHPLTPTVLTITPARMIADSDERSGMHPADEAVRNPTGTSRPNSSDSRAISLIAPAARQNLTSAHTLVTAIPRQTVLATRATNGSSTRSCTRFSATRSELARPAP